MLFRSNIIDIPFRMLEPLTAGLAYRISVKKPEIPPDRIMGLKMAYDEAWELASGEDREKAADRFVPREQFF